MKCPLCGCQFQEEDAKVACKGCLLTGDCHMVKCPNCDYDLPAEPKLVKVFKAWRNKDNGAKRTS